MPSKTYNAEWGVDFAGEAGRQPPEQGQDVASTSDTHQGDAATGGNTASDPLLQNPGDDCLQAVLYQLQRLWMHLYCPPTTPPPFMS